MNLRINKVHYPVTVLGPGQRVGIWTQGCSIHCEGCVSQDTWEETLGVELSIERIMAWIESGLSGPLDGVTITGGEPFDQPEALGALLDGLIGHRAAHGLDFDILVYSGRPLGYLREHHSELLSKIDALIPEPYVTILPVEKIWRGSANQPLISLSDRGVRNYGPHIDQPAASDKPMQIMVEHGKIYYFGIPYRGDMEELKHICETSGITLGEVLWRM